jgi:hypothetical protein
MLNVLRRAIQGEATEDELLRHVPYFDKDAPPGDWIRKLVAEREERGGLGQLDVGGAVSHRFARRLSLSSIHAIAPTPKRITHHQAICASCPPGLANDT